MTEISLSISSDQFEQGDISALSKLSVTHIRLPLYTLDWVAVFGPNLFPTALPHTNALPVDLFQYMVRDIRALGQVPVGVLDGQMYSLQSRDGFKQGLELAVTAGIDTIEIADPSVLLAFKDQFPTLNWQISTAAGVRSLESVQFWSQLGAYHIHLPDLMLGEEVLSLIAYSAKLPVTFSAPILTNPLHVSTDGCRADCYWNTPTFCHEWKPGILEYDPMHQEEFLTKTLTKDSSPNWTPISYKDQFDYQVSDGFLRAFSESATVNFPIKCGACFIPELPENVAWNLQLEGLDSTTVLNRLRWLLSCQKAESKQAIASSLNLPDICRSKSRCLFPDKAASL